MRFYGVHFVTRTPYATKQYALASRQNSHRYARLSYGDYPLGKDKG